MITASKMPANAAIPTRGQVIIRASPMTGKSGREFPLLTKKEGCVGHSLQNMIKFILPTSPHIHMIDT